MIASKSDLFRLWRKKGNFHPYEYYELPNELREVHKKSYNEMQVILEADRKLKLANQDLETLKNEIENAKHFLNCADAHIAERQKKIASAMFGVKEADMRFKSLQEEKRENIEV